METRKHIKPLGDPSWQVREENEALEKSAAVAKGELDQMTKIFEAHARFQDVD